MRERLRRKVREPHNIPPDELRDYLRDADMGRATSVISTPWRSGLFRSDGRSTLS